MNIRTELFKNHSEIFKIVVDFFTAESTNPTLFLDIKRTCFYSNEIPRPNANAELDRGYLSVFDFINFHKKKKSDTLIRIDIVEIILDNLVETNILFRMPDATKGNSMDKRFKAGGALIKSLYQDDLVYNYLCGWEYIIEKYRNSVLKIEHKDLKGDYSIGTGFYYKWHSVPLVITNKHVIENAQSIKLFTYDDKIIKHSITYDNNRDLAYLILEEELSIPSFVLYLHSEVLSEIITAGYPIIPLTKSAHQVFHKGEINSFIEDYNGNKLFLFSAKTSSGNSGGPIIDIYGAVCGIVTEELFEKSMFIEKGKPPYYAAIPSQEIVFSLTENIKNVNFSYLK